MTEKTLTMTAKEFRISLEEKVKMEIAKQLLEVSELENSIGDSTSDSDDLRQKERQKNLLTLIANKIGRRELANFAMFAKKQIGDKDEELRTATTPAEILVRFTEIFTGKIIPQGLSLNALLNQYKTWHAAGGAGIKSLGFASSTEDEESAKDETINTTTTQTGGETLEKIGDTLDPGKHLTAMAVSNILNSLTSSEVGKEGKLDILRKILKDRLEQYAEGDQQALQAFSSTMRRAVNQAAARFVDFIEQSRTMGDGENASLENLIQVLEQNKLRDSMDETDLTNENMFLERLVEIANDIEYVNDDEWEEIVMQMLAQDLLDAPVFAPREELNIVKSFQNLVGNLVKPPPKRGRPKKVQ